MNYTATYYETLCIDTESWHCLDHCVVISNEYEIIDILSYSSYKHHYSHIALKEQKGFSIPACVNAHSHIDNSYLHGKTIGGKGFYTWLTSLLGNRLPQETVQTYIQSHIHIIQEELQDTAFIATIADSPWLHDILKQAKIPHYIFYESIGEHENIPQCQHSSSPYYHISYAGHALYSTSPSTLCNVKKYCMQHNLPFSLHLAEHQEECSFLNGIASEFSSLLTTRLLPHYKAPYMSPVAYADTLGLLDHKTLAVHAVHMSNNDMEIIKKRKTTLCLCPRSNDYIDVGHAQGKKLYEMNIPLCIATDGLASNTSLSMWEEALYAMNIYGFSLKQCLPMITIQPARILGIDTHFGILHKGSYPKTFTIPEV